MAKVQWSAGIDSVSGALAKPTKGSQHSCEHMLLGTHRVAETTNNSCNRLYLRKKVQRKSAPSVEELKARARFTAVSRAVVARSKDLMQINEDQTNFLAQKDSANGFKTMKSYLWAICGDAYDAEQNG